MNAVYAQALDMTERSLVVTQEWSVVRLDSLFEDSNPAHLVDQAALKVISFCLPTISFGKRGITSRGLAQVNAFAGNRSFLPDGGPKSLSDISDEWRKGNYP